MDINSLTTSTLPNITAAGLNNSSNPVDAASIVPVVATPPDPTTIPIEPPHGSPRPPVGQLLPDVAAAEDPSSPMKVNTPPPSTPSPAQIQPQPVPLDAYPDQESEATNQASVAVNGHQYQNGLPVSLDHAVDQSDTDMFDQESAKPEADEDMVMDDSHIQNSTNGIAHPEQVANGSYSVLPDVESPSHATEEYDDGPPPAKRQKLESPDPLNGNEDSPGAGIPLDSPVAPTAPWARPMTQPQNKFALSVVRSMKKHKDAVPFLAPVDPVALNIPHYPTIVTNPMDLSTIERKLGGAPKPETAQYARYANVEEFVTDFRLIVQNCLLFNGPDHLVSQMAKRMEESFDKLMKNMPTADEVKPPVKVVPVKKVAPVRRPSTAGASAPRRDDSYTSNRPKREIPPPREQRDFQPEPRRPPVKKRFPKRDDGTAEQLKFCTKLINDLYRPKYSHCAYPFYEPVDIVKLDIPHYPKVVKKPMDMATMLQKLGAGEYPDAKGVYNDFKLMIKNCFAFNPAGTPVHQAGVELNEIFDEKWLGLPGLHGESDDEVGEDDESDNDHTNAVMLMEAQIQSLHNALASIKKNTKKDKLKKSSPAVPKPPKPAPAKVPGTNGNPFKKKKKAVHDDDEPNLTFEQKKQLSESIQSLDGARLEKVLEIIDEVYPEIRETSEEIELDIDSLPPHVLSKLYNFVIRPMKPRVGRPPNGVGSSNKPVGGAIAGTKRKSMNEEEETAKIRQLEETLYRLKNGIATADDVATAGRATANGGDDSGSDSDDSDSSGSDSE